MSALKTTKRFLYVPMGKNITQVLHPITFELVATITKKVTDTETTPISYIYYEIVSADGYIEEANQYDLAVSYCEENL